MHIGYKIEAIYIDTWIFLLILGYISQALCYRFTVRRKWVGIKLAMISIASVALCLQMVRCIDTSGVFGLYDMPTIHMLTSMVTSTLMHCGSVLVAANARSLYVLLGKQLTPLLRPILIGATVVYQLCLIGAGIAEAVLYSDDLTQFTRMDRYKYLVIRDTTFSITAVWLSVAAWLAIFKLDRVVVQFIQTLRDQEQRTAIAHKTLTQTLPAAAPIPPSESDHIVSGTKSGHASASDVAGGGNTATTTQVPRIVVQTVAPAPTSATSTGGPSPAAQRIAELEAASTKIKRLMVCITIILGIGVIGAIPHWINYGKGKPNLDDVQPASISQYPVGRLLLPTVQCAAMTVVLWFCWLSPSVWMKPATPFWSTLLHGIPEESSTRYTRIEKNQSKLPMTSTVNYVRVAPLPTPNVTSSPKAATNASVMKPPDTIHEATTEPLEEKPPTTSAWTDQNDAV